MRHRPRAAWDWRGLRRPAARAPFRSRPAAPRRRAGRDAARKRGRCRSRSRRDRGRGSRKATSFWTPWRHHRSFRAARAIAYSRFGQSMRYPTMKVVLAIAACMSAASFAMAASFDLQGHRGARGLAPENTLPAFARGLAIGVTTLEMDAAITKDDVVVVSHDPALNPDITRAPDGQWLTQRGPLIRDLTYAELQRYDVGRIKPEANYAKTFPDQAPLDGTRIPKLSEVFDLVKRSGNREVQFDIETKVFPLAPADTLAPEPFTHRLVEEIRKAGMGERTMIQSFDWRTLAIVQKEAPEMRTVYLTVQQRFDNICTGPGAGTPAIAPADCQPSAWTAGFQLREHGSVPRMVKAAGGSIWSPFHGDLDAAKRAEAKALGLLVIPWTVNDRAQIAKMMDLAVDGIISDRPDRVREEMRRRAMPLPPSFEVSPRAQPVPKT